MIEQEKKRGVGVGVRAKEPPLSTSLFFPALYLRAALKAWNRLGFRVRLGRCCVELHHRTVFTQFAYDLDLPNRKKNMASHETIP